jgi:hypothetical protein
MQLIAGLEFNSKNGKKGAFREDRYDATAVNSL